MLYYVIYYTNVILKLKYCYNQSNTEATKQHNTNEKHIPSG